MKGIEKKRKSLSILKQGAEQPVYEEEVVFDDFQTRRSKRVSFADTNSIKEYHVLKESGNTEWNCTYEELAHIDSSSSSSNGTKLLTDSNGESSIDIHNISVFSIDNDKENVLNKSDETTDADINFLSNYLNHNQPKKDDGFFQGSNLRTEDNSTELFESREKGHFVATNNTKIKNKNLAVHNVSNINITEMEMMCSLKDLPSAKSNIDESKLKCNNERCYDSSTIDITLPVSGFIGINSSNDFKQNQPNKLLSLNPSNIHNASRLASAGMDISLSNEIQSDNALIPKDQSINGCPHLDMSLTGRPFPIQGKQQDCQNLENKIKALATNMEFTCTIPLKIEDSVKLTNAVESSGDVYGEGNDMTIAMEMTGVVPTVNRHSISLNEPLFIPSISMTKSISLPTDALLCNSAEKENIIPELMVHCQSVKTVPHREVQHNDNGFLKSFLSNAPQQVGNGKGDISSCMEFTCNAPLQQVDSMDRDQFETCNQEHFDVDMEFTNVGGVVLSNPMESLSNPPENDKIKSDGYFGMNLSITDITSAVPTGIHYKEIDLEGLKVNVGRGSDVSEYSKDMAMGHFEKSPLCNDELRNIFTDRNQSKLKLKTRSIENDDSDLNLSSLISNGNGSKPDHFFSTTISEVCSNQSSCEDEVFHGQNAFSVSSPISLGDEDCMNTTHPIGGLLTDPITNKDNFNISISVICEDLPAKVDIDAEENVKIEIINDCNNKSQRKSILKMTSLSDIQNTSVSRDKLIDFDLDKQNLSKPNPPTSNNHSKFLDNTATIVFDELVENENKHKFQNDQCLDGLSGIRKPSQTQIVDEPGNYTLNEHSDLEISDPDVSPSNNHSKCLDDLVGITSIKAQVETEDNIVQDGQCSISPNKSGLTNFQQKRLSTSPHPDEPFLKLLASEIIKCDSSEAKTFSDMEETMMCSKKLEFNPIHSDSSSMNIDISFKSGTSLLGFSNSCVETCSMTVITIPEIANVSEKWSETKENINAKESKQYVPEKCVSAVASDVDLPVATNIDNSEESNYVKSQHGTRDNFDLDENDSIEVDKTVELSQKKCVNNSTLKKSMLEINEIFNSMCNKIDTSLSVDESDCNIEQNCSMNKANDESKILIKDEAVVKNDLLVLADLENKIDLTFNLQNNNDSLVLKKSCSVNINDVPASTNFEKPILSSTLREIDAIDGGFIQNDIPYKNQLPKTPENKSVNKNLDFDLAKARCGYQKVPIIEKLTQLPKKDAKVETVKKLIEQSKFLNVHGEKEKFNNYCYKCLELKKSTKIITFRARSFDLKNNLDSMELKLLGLNLKIHLIFIDSGQHRKINRAFWSPQVIELKKPIAILAMKTLGCLMNEEIDKLCSLHFCDLPIQLDCVIKAYENVMSFLKDLYFVTSIFVTRVSNDGIYIQFSNPWRFIRVSLDIVFISPEPPSPFPTILCEAKILNGNIRLRALEDAIDGIEKGPQQLRTIVNCIKSIIG